MAGRKAETLNYSVTLKLFWLTLLIPTFFFYYYILSLYLVIYKQLGHQQMDQNHTAMMCFLIGKLFCA